MTADAFYFFCQENPDHCFEREPDGRIIVMPDTEGKTGNKNAEINDDVIIWNHRMRMVFDSSTAFDKPFSGEDVLSDFILHLA